MNNFIFWNNLPSNALDIQALRQHIIPHSIADVSTRSATSQIDVKVINDNCGLIFTQHPECSPILIDKADLLAFSPGNHSKASSVKTLNAISRITDKYISDSQFHPEYLNNNFSLLLFDKDNNKIHAAIDRFGVERLFYSSTNGIIVISNQLSAIVSILPNVSYSSQAIYNFVDSHIIPSPLTIYQDIYKFEPSQTVCFEAPSGKLHKKIYWLPAFNETAPENLESLYEKTRKTISNAITHCDLTEKSGAFLSGGLDSSSVAGYMAKNSTSKVTAYTMGFEEAGYDETEYARIAADHFGLNLKSYYVTPDDVASAFSHVIRNYDEPFGNSSAIPAFLCARFAYDDGVSTMLAGDGGDEIFAGNERYVKQQVFEYYQHIPSIVRKALLEPLFYNALPHTKMQPFIKIKNYIEQALTPMPDRMERYNFINHFSAVSIFSKEFLVSIDQTFPICEKRDVYNRPKNATMLNRMLYMDWKFTLADNDLIKVGTACKLAGIKVQYPMLDDDLVNLSTQIASPLKMKNGRELRSFYKEAMKNVLPKEIINKKKHGFGLPFGEWLKKSAVLQEKIYDNLNSLKQRHYFDPHFIDHIINTHRTQSAAAYFGSMVWILSVLQEWLESRTN